MVGGGLGVLLHPLQRWSWCILQLQPSELKNYRIGTLKGYPIFILFYFFLLFLFIEQEINQSQIRYKTLYLIAEHSSFIKHTLNKLDLII